MSRVNTHGPRYRIAARYCSEGPAGPLGGRCRFSPGGWTAQSGSLLMLPRCSGVDRRGVSRATVSKRRPRPTPEHPRPRQHHRVRAGHPGPGTEARALSPQAPISGQGTMHSRRYGGVASRRSTILPLLSIRLHRSEGGATIAAPRSPPFRRAPPPCRPFAMLHCCARALRPSRWRSRSSPRRASPAPACYAMRAGRLRGAAERSE